MKTTPAHRVHHIESSDALLPSSSSCLVDSVAVSSRAPPQSPTCRIHCHRYHVEEGHGAIVSARVPAPSSSHAHRSHIGRLLRHQSTGRRGQPIDWSSSVHGRARRERGRAGAAASTAAASLLVAFTVELEGIPFPPEITVRQGTLAPCSRSSSTPSKHLEKWKDRKVEELDEDDAFFVSPPVDKLFRVVVIKEIKGPLYGGRVAVDRYEDEEEEALEKITDFFQSKYFKPKPIEVSNGNSMTNAADAEQDVQELDDVVEQLAHLDVYLLGVHKLPRRAQA
ncbi:hypothetical protein ACP70R_034667 [Stipagrostis hirtigluma subsp. patula]